MPARDAAEVPPHSERHARLQSEVALSRDGDRELAIHVVLGSLVPCLHHLQLLPRAAQGLLQAPGPLLQAVDALILLGEGRNKLPKALLRATLDYCICRVVC